MMNRKPCGRSADLLPIRKLWRRGSVVASWLLDLTAAALVDDAESKQFAGPTAVLSTSLYPRLLARPHTHDLRGDGPS